MITQQPSKKQNNATKALTNLWSSMISFIFGVNNINFCSAGFE